MFSFSCDIGILSSLHRYGRAYIPHTPQARPLFSQKGTHLAAERKLDLIYIDSGGGHRAAATALMEVMQSQRRPWNVRLLCIQDLLDSIDFIRKSTGIPFQDVYNRMLRHGWTLGTAQLIPLMHMLIRLTHSAQVRVLEQQWRAERPDLVLSLIPHYNRALKEALQRVWPETPYVTALTDIADYPPHFWIERQDQYVICGSEQSVRQARELGLPEDRILQTSGMILNPKFYTAPKIDRQAERTRLGLQPDLPTGVVLFGGEGSTEMVKIAKSLNRDDAGLQVIFLCGKNEVVARELRALLPRVPMRIEGFTSEIPYFMALADFFVGKPGPGSISEALAMHLPVVVQRNAWTLAHERYNADWIEERGVGMVVSNFSQVFAATRQLLSPLHYPRFQQRAKEIRNFAVYEIPELIERIMRSSAHPPGSGFNPPTPSSSVSRYLPDSAHSA